MSYPKRNTRTGKYEIRWLDGGRHRQRTFTRKGDAQEAWNQIQRLKETDGLGMLTAGDETLGEFADQLGDAALVSALAYAGLRPYNEALALGWEQITDGRLLIERKLVDGALKPGTETDTAQSIRLLEPLAADLEDWRAVCGRPATGLVFPRSDGEPWAEHDNGNWRRRTFDPLTQARPYDLRHTFASLLIWEGRPITYVAQQLGHSPQTCLTTYAHVIDEAEANVPAEAMILDARTNLHIAKSDPANPTLKTMLRIS